MIEFIIPFIVTAVLALTGPPLRLIRVITDNLRQVSHDTSTSNLVRFRSASTETLSVTVDVGTSTEATRRGGSSC
ncbi:uncharacterized protein LOC135385169 isoform X4 [Ornithodoros turicata]|uniref:uncharacterized protein LOC135385169 isoform X4 n=1 Tax=Ornithodoros turicata TaxID=34597 RepID=UPI00313880BC